MYCFNCGHSFDFHGFGGGPCLAGCVCHTYQECPPTYNQEERRVIDGMVRRLRNEDDRRLLRYDLELIRDADGHLHWVE